MSGTIMDTNLPQPGEPVVQEGLEASPSPPPPVVITPPAAESRLRRIGMAFLFWLIYLLMFGICLTLLSVFMHFAHRGRSGPVWWGMVAQIGAVLSAIIPAVVMGRIEKRPFGEFGLPAKNAFRLSDWLPRAGAVSCGCRCVQMPPDVAEAVEVRAERKTVLQPRKPCRKPSGRSFTSTAAPRASRRRAWRR